MQPGDTSDSGVLDGKLARYRAGAAMPARPFWRRLVRSALVSVLLAALALGARLLFDPTLGQNFPFASVFLATTIAAWLAGPVAGACTAALAWFALDHWLLPPPDAGALVTLVRTGWFVGLSTVVIALVTQVRSSRRRLEAAHRALEERHARLEQEVSLRSRLEEQSATAAAREQAARRSLEERIEELEKLMDLIPVGIYLAHDSQCERVTSNATGGALLPPASSAHRLFREGRELDAGEHPLRRAAAQRRQINGEE